MNESDGLGCNYDRYSGRIRILTVIVAIEWARLGPNRAMFLIVSRISLFRTGSPQLFIDGGKLIN